MDQQPSAADVALARRFMIGVRIAVCAFLALIAFGLWASNRRPEARWIHGKTAQGLPVSLLLVGGNLRDYYVNWSAECDFDHPLEGRTTLGGGEAYYGRGEAERNLVSTIHEPLTAAKGRLTGERYRELRAAIEGSAVAGTLTVRETWQRSGEAAGTCAAGDVRFRVPL